MRRTRRLPRNRRKTRRKSRLIKQRGGEGGDPYPINSPEAKRAIEERKRQREIKNAANAAAYARTRTNTVIVEPADPELLAKRKECVTAKSTRRSAFIENRQINRTKGQPCHIYPIWGNHDCGSGLKCQMTNDTDLKITELQCHPKDDQTPSRLDKLLGTFDKPRTENQCETEFMSAVEDSSRKKHPGNYPRYPE
jgi:hypothetical protein